MFERWLEVEEKATFEKIIDIFEKAKLLGVLQQWYSQYRIEGTLRPVVLNMWHVPNLWAWWFKTL